MYSKSKEGKRAKILGCDHRWVKTSYSCKAALARISSLLPSLAPPPNSSPASSPRHSKASLALPSRPMEPKLTKTCGCNNLAGKTKLCTKENNATQRMTRTMQSSPKNTTCSSNLRRHRRRWVKGAGRTRPDSAAPTLTRPTTATRLALSNF